MITLTFPWLVALVVLLFLAIFVLMACFKSPMRKWICFGLSFISIAYLLYIMMWHQDGAGQPLDWFLLGGVGVLAALVLAGVGFMDLVRPVTSPEEAPVQDRSSVSSSKEEIPTIPVHPEVDVAENHVEKESEENTEPESVTESDVKDETDTEITIDEEDRSNDTGNAEEDEEEKMRKEELVGKVLPWFLDQLNQYSDEEKAAIKACAIAFVNDGTISKPTVPIQNNNLYSHERLIELCSAFYLIGKPKEACISFAKQVFAIPFANTEERTISRKIKGANTMLVLIDTYWEAKKIPL